MALVIVCAAASRASKVAARHRLRRSLARLATHYARTMAASRIVSESTAVWLVLLNVTLYAVCYQLQRPVEPFLVKSLSEGADGAEVARTYGRLQSFFSFVQTLSLIHISEPTRPY